MLENEGMKGQNIGYLRVSSVDQKTDRQLDGVNLDKVFTEKASAKDTNRPQLQAAMEYLRMGDTLHVHSIDRLARNLADLQRVVEELTGKGVSVRFHKENLVFNDQGDAMSKLMLQMMGAFAEFERSLIRERQREGIEKAKKAGKYKGRKRSLTDKDMEGAWIMLNDGMSKAEVARELGVSRQTLYSSLKR